MKVGATSTKRVSLNPSTGYADEGDYADPWGGTADIIVPDVTTTLTSDLVPTDSTAVLDPTTLDGGTGTVISPGHYRDALGYNWVFNAIQGVWYNYGNGPSGEVGTYGTTANGETTILELVPEPLTFDTSCWGFKSPPSCVTMQDEDGNDSSRVTGTALTGDTWNTGTALTHINNVAGAPSLTSIGFVDGLQLQSNLLVDGFFNVPELLLPVTFVETFRDSKALWPVAPRDMFIVDFSVLPPEVLADVSFGPDFVDFTVNVVFEDSDFVANGDTYHKNYAVTTRLSGLDFFQSADNAQVVGILTEENTRNTVNASFKITAVAEPALLGVFGALAMIVSGFARRKAKA